jgi:hypothetical protein
MRLIRYYVWDIIAGAIFAGVYGWYMGSWKHFVLGIFSVLIGYMTIEWCGHMIPGVNWLIYKWERERERKDDDERG